MSRYQPPTTKIERIRKLRRKRRFFQKDLILLLGGAHSQTRYALDVLESNGEIKKIRIGNNVLIEFIPRK